MCGICGVLNFDPTNAVHPELLGAMTDVISHRGPDDSGYFLDGRIGLGHRRLSIIDLSGGKQPIYNEDGTIAVVFNGEIYNYADLTEELVARGHAFKTRSDTETIVHAYEEYGEDCVARFRGMFAFALWDSRKERLLLVRDRLGIKPVYYYQDRESLAFASEVKSLLEIPSAPRDLDETSLDLYLSLRYVPGPRTMFRGIHKLQPGHLLVADGDGVRVRKYWDVPHSEPVSASSLNDAAAEFDRLLEESVRLRMIAEVPLGVFLSGGLDSSAILAMMSRVRQGDPIKTFSVGYESPDGGEDENNEFHYARQAAKAFGAEHHEYRLNAVDFSEFVPKLVWHLDEPLADPSCIPLHFISRLAREHITVVLSGEGADEILAGYAIYPKMLAMEKLRAIPGAGAISGRLSSLLPESRYQTALRMTGQSLSSRYRGVCRGFRPAMQARLTGARFDANVLDRVFDPYFHDARHADPLDQMLHVDHKVWLPDDLLLKADKMTMANSLELRVPFLDHKVVEFASRLPVTMKYDAGTGKVLLRHIMRSVLPYSILHRSKKGFPVPMLTWLRGPLNEFTRATLLARDSACCHYFEPRVIREIVEGHDAGADRQQEMWSLVIFEFWHRAFLKQHRSLARHTGVFSVAKTA